MSLCKCVNVLCKTSDGPFTTLNVVSKKEIQSSEDEFRKKSRITQYHHFRIHEFKNNNEGYNKYSASSVQLVAFNSRTSLFADV